MEFHIDRQLRMEYETQHKSLYPWSINEVGEQGNLVGRDQIPWEWSVYFIAKSIKLADQFDLDNAGFLTTNKDDAVKATDRQVIVLSLRPGSQDGDEDSWRTTKLYMFGTSRELTDIRLDIRPLVKFTDPETCTVWGGVSYTAETDFRDETQPDCLVFSLFVRPDTFARYNKNLTSGLVSDVVFRVSSVEGFYSDWSPSISTDSVKVLTRGNEHNVEKPANCDIEPPRLGKVGAMSLYINRHVDLDRPKQNSMNQQMSEPAVRKIELEPESIQTVPLLTNIIGHGAIKTLRSIERTTWLMLAVLALILLWK